MRRLLFLVIFTIFSSTVFAEGGENKYVHILGERTKDNLHVNKTNAGISVKDENIAYILATPYVDTSYKIYDFADLLTDKEEEAIKKRCHEFIAKTGLDIAIVTLAQNDHPGYQSWNSSEAYISDFYDYNDFGKDDVYSGVMLLIDKHYDRNSILDAGKPSFDSFMGYHLEYYGSTMRPLYDLNDYYAEINWFIENCEKDWLYDQSFPIWKCLIFAMILTLIIFFVHKRKYKLVFKKTSANDYKVKDSFKLSENSTDFVRTFTTKVYSPRQKSSGGGGSGSSGASHSGGSF